MYNKICVVMSAFLTTKSVVNSGQQGCVAVVRISDYQKCSDVRIFDYKSVVDNLQQRSVIGVRIFHCQKCREVRIFDYQKCSK